MKIMVRENADKDKVVISYDEELRAILAKVIEILCNVEKTSPTFGAEGCVLNLINCRNSIDDVINSIAFTNA